MNMERTERHATVREGYQILLRADAELLLPVEKPRIRSFYEHLAETCMTWAQSVYGETLRREFLELESIRERSRFAAQHYRLCMRVPWEDGERIALLCESWLTGQWKEPQKSYHRIAHVWNTAEESILPHAEVLSLCGIRLGQGKLPFRPDGIYPEDGYAVMFRNVPDNMTFLEHKFPMEAKNE